MKTLIYVGEHDLALDNISYFYLKNTTALSKTAFEIIERLAIILEMEESLEFAAVARLLAAAARNFGGT